MCVYTLHKTVCGSSVSTYQNALTFLFTIHLHRQQLLEFSTSVLSTFYIFYFEGIVLESIFAS